MEGDLASSMRSFDAWIAETATAAWNLWDSDATEREAWALEKLCIGLTQSGGLVPLAKKYAGPTSYRFFLAQPPFFKKTTYHI